MAIEFTGTADERRWREAMAFVYRDAPGRMPADLPVVQDLDPDTLHALHDALKREAGESAGGIRRASDTYSKTRKRVGMLYIPKALRQAMGIKAEILRDRTLDPNDIKTRALERHELQHRRQDLEGRWDGLGYEGREREAQGVEKAFFDLYVQTGIDLRSANSEPSSRARLDGTAHDHDT